eukprot:TRINITY_DN27220_c0_g1_i1.p1 TRINITY_DN27220_c0_g1~~TRINITY_DN27220_c0_g1_i1.p1  ORF type:complete len:351 (+),score=76.56 TRINITY_DN27220_c0_g1_i1:71-1123(+)
MRHENSMPRPGLPSAPRAPPMQELQENAVVGILPKGGAAPSKMVFSGKDEAASEQVSSGRNASSASPPPRETRIGLSLSEASPSSGGVGGQGRPAWGLHGGGFAQPPSGYAQHRKRPAGIAFFVDSEFRAPQAEPEPVRSAARHDSLLASPTPASSSSAPAAAASLSSSSSSPAADEVETGSATAAVAFAGVRSCMTVPGSETPVAETLGEAAQVGSSSAGGGVGSDSSSSEAESDPDKENQAPDWWAEADAVDISTRVLRPPFETPGGESGEGEGGGLREVRAILQELALEVPDELQAQMQEDNHADAADVSDDDGFYSENLAEQLEERIRQNVDGRYDFEIFVDPENR